MGLTVLVNDVDVVYIQNPMSHLFCVSCDLLMTTDHSVYGQAIEKDYNTGMNSNQIRSTYSEYYIQIIAYWNNDFFSMS